MNPDTPQHTRRNPLVFGSFPSATSSFVKCAAVIVSMAASATAAVITQNGGADASGESSLTQGVNWSDGLAPSGGNDYVSATLIRTPAVSSNTTFAGDSLTFNAGGSMSFRGTGTTSTISISQLNLNGNAYVISQANSTHFTLAGNIALGSTLTGGFQIGSSGNMTVSSNITGLGKLTVNWLASSAAITLSHANNTYSGGTLITGNSTAVLLNVAADGALGSGNVTVSNAKLTLGGGTVHNYIGNSATLTLSAGLAASAINLNFSGTDALAGISLDGGSTYLGIGTYSASALNTLYGSSAFTGSGNLQIVPEPGSAALLGLGLLLVTAMVRRPRRG